MRLSTAWALLFLAACASAETLPVDTKIEVRLQTKVASASKTGDKFEAVVIAPVLIGDRTLIPAGSLITGAVKAAKASTADARAELDLDFTELVWPAGAKQPLSAKVVGVDNTRESVDADGHILGILDSETLTSQMDRGLEKLGTKFSGFADLLSIVKGAVLKKADSEITYEAGAEMQLALTKALEVTREQPPPKVKLIEPRADLEALVNALPFQTTAAKPPRPSDLTNLLYIGTRDEVVAAFTAAGWSPAEKVNTLTGLETFRAVAEQRGYKEAPMSTLLLEGEPPEMVFQKQFNTFAQRHHLRIFKRPERFEGREVWACAATHDIGIDFSPENRTFIHKIETDGRMAILLLQ